MKTFKRTCIKDFKVTAKNGDCFEIIKGDEYLTSEVEDEKVTVFLHFWVKVLIKYFTGEKVFTI